MRRTSTIVFGAALFLFTSWWIVRACAPEFEVAVFSYKRHPDLPRAGFVNGNLGVLQPTFARSYLVIAYRYLNGAGLNQREREQARDYYKDRETGTWDHVGTDWPAKWQAARARITSVAAPHQTQVGNGQQAYDPETHSFLLNCAEDAYRVALHTFEDRRNRFGASSRAFIAWLTAQDAVFANCDGSQLTIPPEAAAGLPSLIRADREYQIAAANFYAGKYQTALDRFERIGRDASSPWNMISRYVVARTLFRMTESSAPAGAGLQRECMRIVADAKLVPIHGMTLNLLHRAGVLEQDSAYFRSLAILLSSRGQDDGLREELWNYTTMYDKFIEGPDPSPFRNADLTSWIYNFQARDAGAEAQSMSRWKQTHSTPWLLAALTHATSRTPERADLLNAAAHIPRDSPGYLTALYHADRLQLAAGNRAGIRDSLESIIGDPALRPLPSSVNLFRGLRMSAAPNLADFLRSALRKPVLITYSSNVGEVPAYFADPKTSQNSAAVARFDRDATRILNIRTPFRLLKETALGDVLPVGLRREAVMTALTRGLLLDQDISGIVEKLGAAAPELKSRVDAYRHEDTDQGRRFAAAFLILGQPEARPFFAPGISRHTRSGKIDSFRDNWWCPLDLTELYDSHEAAVAITPGFLTGEAEEAEKELRVLKRRGNAADFLGFIVLDYAGNHADDPRIPEALHDIVRSSRYGCNDDNTWKTARRAFQLLHKRYPKSVWAGRTPSWTKETSIREQMKWEREHQQ